MPELPGARWFAEQLERGAWQRHPVAGALSSLWAGVADPVRPLELPESARVIGVGGATLGGSGKSTVTLELARALARGGARVAVVASAYPARDRTPRRVRRDEPVERAGDEALWLARALDVDGVAVFIGAPRRSAIAAAASGASVVIVDGLLQARPRRLALSLLALDATAPWGSLRCPPAGDLRARRSLILAACDAVLLSTDPAVCQELGDVQFYGKTAFRWSSELSGARTRGGDLVSVEQLRGLRLGLLLAVARPERIRSALAARGIRIHAVVLRGDHAPLNPPPSEGLDAWLTTAKCATKVPQNAAAAPVWTLEHRACLPARLICAAKGPP